MRGDALRDATGIRPSLHPLTINILADALKVRARNDPLVPLQVVVDETASTSSSSSSLSVSPLQVAVAAGKLAADAIGKRQDASRNDDMTLTMSEQQTVAGRVVAVVMRLPDLEANLYTKCCQSSWVAKYREWDAFGVLQEENASNSDLTLPLVHARVVADPLFAMNRAECLLALYLDQVEGPELARKNATVSDNSTVDFLDSERRQVLLEA
jgi:hypothetical protein